MSDEGSTELGVKESFCLDSSLMFFFFNDRSGTRISDDTWKRQLVLTIDFIRRLPVLFDWISPSTICSTLVALCAALAS